MPHFTEDNLQRIIINPFYAITVAPPLTEEHEPAMSEAAWVQANASLMREMGSERWLRQLLDVLEGKAATPEQPINPSQAVNIDPLFAAGHPPLIGREMWVDVNAMQIRTMGTEGWLRQLLEVLTGDIVTAEEVGFAPPGGAFGYGVPGRSHAQRRGKKKRKKRRHK
jgi:type IV secretory pathway VirB2 component (pilin)